MAATAAAFLLLLLPRLIAGTSPPSISASPSILPSGEPSLPPDIMPVFPSPQTGYAPDGPLPTIPSNLSPPNPDSLDPNSALPPFASSNASPPGFSCLLFGLAAMWLLK